MQGTWLTAKGRIRKLSKNNEWNLILSPLAPNGPEKWGCRTHVEWEFKTYIVNFETYLVKRDYETKKTAGALEPPEPPSLAPMYIPLLNLE